MKPEERAEAVIDATWPGLKPPISLESLEYEIEAAIRAAEAEARERALLEAAATRCRDCGVNVPLNGSFHQHPRGVFLECAAWPIRALKSAPKEPG